ncbi:hypothetical protein FQA47_003940 [Oryzias melastigma]|uniref:Uncharacterized protein n=1 Tax=Oryzias melastigma TaxID=30732 RepID=A0A834C5B0_ORYME|nr:hypothetical protein FQA47_003940 [Oryzias melastigma]
MMNAQPLAFKGNPSGGSRTGLVCGVLSSNSGETFGIQTFMSLNSHLPMNLRSWVCVRGGGGGRHITPSEPQDSSDVPVGASSLLSESVLQSELSGPMTQ